MKDVPRQWKITGFFPLAAAVLFAACLLAVLLTGAKVYRTILDKNQAAFAQRSAVQYVTTRVRQADRADTIRVERIDGMDVLLLEETVNGKDYVTYVYCYEGKIRELFTKAGYEFSPQDGEVILDAKSMAFSWEAPILSVHILFVDETQRSVSLRVRSSGEVFL